jgi:hypothetical protein
MLLVGRTPRPEIIGSAPPRRWRNTAVFEGLITQPVTDFNLQQYTNSQSLMAGPRFEQRSRQFGHFASSICLVTLLTRPDPY